MKRIATMFAAVAAVSAPGAAMALQLDYAAGFPEVERSDPYSIRQCPGKDGSWGRFLCYNTTSTRELRLAWIPMPVEWSNSRIHRVDCKIRSAYHPESMNGKIAAKYCPQMPKVAPAPFLSLRD